MSWQETKRFKVKEWKRCFEGMTDCLFDVEVEHTYNVPVLAGENYSNYCFKMSNYYKVIKLFELTKFNYLSKGGSNVTQCIYELEVVDKTTNKTTKYKLVKTD